MAGMTIAAAVTSNTVVLKPSSDAPLLAALFMDVLEKAGMPAGVVNLLTGPGSSVGDYLVEHPKTRFISFTGSKADVADAVEGVAIGAFGFQGQKCSACSRAIVDAKVYDEFVRLLVERVKKITVGPTADRANWMGPVINERAYESHLEYIAIGKKEGRLVAGGKPGPETGWFIQP